jgi:peptidoglycan/xylan/chitin deacetylase (PgdA/CDA1 family)
LRTVSIVVPAYNEAELLPGCLASLLAQDYAGPIEILVVDNASTDGTADVARGLGVRVVPEPVRGYGRALRRGFASATGNVICATDADTIVPRDWISRFVFAYDAHPDVVAVGGGIEFTNANLKGRILTRGILPWLNRIDRANPAGPHLWGANLSVLRSAFDACGGWNPAFSFQADTELSERLRGVGRVMALPDVKVRTSSRRWNHSLFPNMLQSVSNFAWFHLTGKPLWREFSAIRDAGESRRTWRPLGLPARAWAAGVAAAFVGFLGYGAISPWSSAFGHTYWTEHTNRKVIALTFDDGPEDPYTSQVLAILEHEKVHATFFLVGENLLLDPGPARRMALDGDAIGNHTETHTAAFALEPEDAQARDLDVAERTIHEVTGQYPRFFRPPQGLRSPWMMNLLARDSLVTVTWDDAPRDWERRSPEALVRSTLEQAHPGAIVLLHDGLNLDHRADRSATVAALPAIIERLRAEGYEFVTLPQLLRAPQTLTAWRPVDVRRRV